jgi:sialate O-acetylesterase
LPEEYEPLAKRWTDVVAAYPKAQEKFQNNRALWRTKSDSLKALGQEVTARRPRAPRGPNHPHRPSVLYNGMIAPLIPYAIQGAIWYQGESNAGRAYQYRALFPAMIQNWRSNWGQSAFPFLFVQLANFRQTKEQPDESTWAELREAQQMTLSLPNTGMAVIIDIGEAKDIHPKNKQDVGLRLALAAEAQVYDIDQPYSGPMYRAMAVENSKIHLSFEHINGGLKTKGKELTGFAIAGQDRKFVWANAKIEGNRVVVWSKNVPQPVAIRYAWADNPICNLYNGADLPALPFRTDDWPGITADKR